MFTNDNVIKLLNEKADILASGKTVSCPLALVELFVSICKDKCISVNGGAFYGGRQFFYI